MRCTMLRIIALGFAATTLAQDFERFQHFQEAGVHDPGVSATAANSLVSEGIASGNSRIIDMTIRGLGDLAANLAHQLPAEYGEYPVRAFSEVAGLKEFLIEHWRRQHEIAGRNSLEATVRELGGRLVDGSTLELSVADLGLEESADGNVDATALISKLREKVSPWGSIPQILAVYWPGDGDVEQFLYDMHDADQSSTKMLTTLGLLNTGKFASDRANQFREQQLGASNTGDPSVSIAVTFAAEGLALSPPVYALPALIDAAMEHPTARPRNPCYDVALRGRRLGAVCAGDREAARRRSRLAADGCGNRSGRTSQEDHGTTVVPFGNHRQHAAWQCLLR